MELTGKTAVVIGGADGIGRAGCLALAVAGAAVVVADRDDARARQTADDVVRDGGRAVAVRCDATQDEDWTALATAARGFGAVDIVWVHAGGSVAGPPERIPLDTWRDLFDLNVLGAVRALRTFIPEMSERGSGHLVLTASGLGLFPEDIPGLAAPYIVTKASQIALARTLKPYLEPRGIGVSVLVPDLTATRHATDVPTVELDPQALGPTVDPAAMQQPDAVADLLVQGLLSDTFLISAVPRTRERLQAAAGSLLTSSTPAPTPLLQYVRVDADATKHDELGSLLAQTSVNVSQEPGAVAYLVGADPARPGRFHLFEEWASAADFERHTQTPGAKAILGVLPEFGIASLRIRRYAVSSAEDDVLDAAPPAP